MQFTVAVPLPRHQLCRKAFEAFAIGLALFVLGPVCRLVGSVRSVVGWHRPRLILRSGLPGGHCCKKPGFAPICHHGWCTLGLHRRPRVLRRYVNRVGRGLFALDWCCPGGQATSTPDLARGLVLEEIFQVLPLGKEPSVPLLDCDGMATCGLQGCRCSRLFITNRDFGNARGCICPCRPTDSLIFPEIILQQVAHPLVWPWIARDPEEGERVSELSHPLQHSEPVFVRLTCGRVKSAPRCGGCISTSELTLQGCY